MSPAGRWPRCARRGCHRRASSGWHLCREHQGKVALTLTLARMVDRGEAYRERGADGRVRFGLVKP